MASPDPFWLVIDGEMLHSNHYRFQNIKHAVTFVSPPPRYKKAILFYVTEQILPFLFCTAKQIILQNERTLRLSGVITRLFTGRCQYYYGTSVNPTDSTALRSSSSEAVPSMKASLVSSTTRAEVTPSTPCSAFSAAARQWLQFMPSI